MMSCFTHLTFFVLMLSSAPHHPPPSSITRLRKWPLPLATSASCHGYSVVDREGERSNTQSIDECLSGDSTNQSFSPSQPVCLSVCLSFHVSPSCSHFFYNWVAYCFSADLSFSVSSPDTVNDTLRYHHNNNLPTIKTILPVANVIICSMLPWWRIYRKRLAGREITVLEIALTLKYLERQFSTKPLSS